MHFSTTRLLLVLFIATYLRKGETSVVYFECPDNHPEIAYIEIGPLRPSSVKGRDPDSPDWKNVTMTKITLLCKTNATWVYPGGEVKVKIIERDVASAETTSIRPPQVECKKGSCFRSKIRLEDLRQWHKGNSLCEATQWTKNASEQSCPRGWVFLDLGVDKSGTQQSTWKGRARTGMMVVKKTQDPVVLGLLCTVLILSLATTVATVISLCRRKNEHAGVLVSASGESTDVQESVIMSDNAYYE